MIEEASKCHLQSISSPQDKNPHINIPWRIQTFLKLKKKKNLSITYTQKTAHFISIKLNKFSVGECIQVTIRTDQEADILSIALTAF